MICSYISISFQTYIIKVFLKLSENKFVHRIFTKLPIAYQRRQQFNIINQQLKYEIDICENWN